jgi:hypothetical protein
MTEHGWSEYQLQIPSPVWGAQGFALVAVASAREAEAVLNWYASMAVLGYALSKRVGPEGSSLTGPDRTRLHAAHSAAQRLAARWNFRKGHQFSRRCSMNHPLRPNPALRAPAAAGRRAPRRLSPDYS